VVVVPVAPVVSVPVVVVVVPVVVTTLFCALPGHAEQSHVVPEATSSVVIAELVVVVLLAVLASTLVEVLVVLFSVIVPAGALQATKIPKQAIMANKFFIKYIIKSFFSKMGPL